jgi:hypothetical protein
MRDLVAPESTMSRVAALGRPVLLLFGLGGCGAGWHRLDDVTPRSLPARQQVQLWMGQGTRVLHAVTLGPDSVTGVPFHRPPDCDCRVALPRSAIDSMRLGNQERGAVRSIGLGYLTLVAAGGLLYWLGFGGD